MAMPLHLWAALPLSALQGLWLRRRATRLPPAPGERAGAFGSGADFHFLALGDSIIDGVGIERMRDTLPVQFARILAQTRGCRVHWRVEGTSGHDIANVLERLNGLALATAPDLVLLSVGVNDVTGLSSLRHWTECLSRLLNTLRDRWPGARLLFAGLPPMEKFPLPPQPLRATLGHRAAELDRIATRLVETFPNAAHFPTEISPEEHDFCPDGFHPSAESCNLWAQALLTVESRRESS
jgi:lysophospholipase L1-like esterase